MKMKFKHFIYTPIILLITNLHLISANEPGDIISNSSQGYKLEKFIATWNNSSENIQQDDEEFSERSASSFSTDISKCLEGHQQQITEDVTHAKSIILNCFKAALILHMFRYLGDPSKSSIKLFNGILEFKKVPEKVSIECSGEGCEYSRNFGTLNRKKDEYVRIYKKAMQKLIDEKIRLNSYRNQTEEEKVKQLNRINENSQAFLSEVIRNLGNEDVEKAEEEKLKKEITDPKLLSVLDTLSRDYLLKFRFYPGVSARMMRSENGGFTFDLEIQDSGESLEEGTSDESSTREIKDVPQAKDYFDDDDDDGIRKKKKSKKGNKKKKKEIKKKAKKLKKIIPYLLLPILIQMTLLPFVFKKLFFLAMKALFAGKVALILIGFNLLRNTCIKNEDDYSQKIRVEHYGYRKGEEYGAWINGRSLQEPSVLTALSEEPFRRQQRE